MSQSGAVSAANVDQHARIFFWSGLLPPSPPPHPALFTKARTFAGIDAKYCWSIASSRCCASAAQPRPGGIRSTAWGLRSASFLCQIPRMPRTSVPCHFRTPTEHGYTSTGFEIIYRSGRHRRRSGKTGCKASPGRLDNRCLASDLEAKCQTAAVPRRQAAPKTLRNGGR